MATSLEYAYMAVDAYSDPSLDTTALKNPQAPAGWTLFEFPTTDTFIPSDPEFYAIAYENNATGEVVIAYRGTDSLTDLFTDSAGIAFGFLTDQVRDAYDFYQAVLTQLGVDAATTKISFTGHSLGGALAGAMAAWAHLPATVFAPAPYGVVATKIADGNHILPPAAGGVTDTSRIDIYRVDGEAVSAHFSSSEYPRTLNVFNEGFVDGAGYLRDSYFSPWDGDWAGLPIPLHSMALHAFLTYTDTLTAYGQQPYSKVVSTGLR